MILLMIKNPAQIKGNILAPNFYSDMGGLDIYFSVKMPVQYWLYIIEIYWVSLIILHYSIHDYIIFQQVPQLKTKYPPKV